MSQPPTTLSGLRDLHVELALRFELYARTTDDGAEVPLLLNKREEAWSGALYFQSLIDQGVTVIPARNTRVV